MKVLLLAKRPTQNEVEFYNLLGKQCDLTVVFEQFAFGENAWEFSTAGNNFTSTFLQSINFGEEINLAFGIGNIIRDSSYDVYVLQGCNTRAEKSAIKELVISNKKFVIASQGAFPSIDEGNLAKRRISGYLKSASYYLSTGSACDAYFSSYGVDMSKVYRYNYATFSETDMIKVTPMTNARQRGLKKRFRLNENIFISTIDFNVEQGIDILLDIWKLAGIKNATLLIISDARKKKELHKMARNAALNDIVMLDYQPRELTRELMRISKAFVYPVRQDVWGLPVVEALCCRVPVISSYNVGAVHDLVHNSKTGYIQNVHEPIGWGERMREMIEREILRDKMKDNISNSMKLFTVESRVKAYMDVFKKCAIIQRR